MQSDDTGPNKKSRLRVETLTEDKEIRKSDKDMKNNFNFVWWALLSIIIAIAVHFRVINVGQLFGSSNSKPTPQANRDFCKISSASPKCKSGDIVFAKDDNIITLSAEHFRNLNDVESLDISNLDKVDSIAEETFIDKRIKKVIFGSNSNIKTIGNRAFLNGILNSLKIPHQVKEIGVKAFYGNKDLKSSNNVCYEADNIEEIKIAEGAFDDHIKVNEISRCSCELKDVSSYYCRTGPVKIIESASEKKLLKISAGILKDSLITSIDLSSLTSLQEVEKESFASCSIEKVVLPKSIHYLRRQCFEENYIGSLNLSEIVDLKHIEDKAFRQNNISVLIFPNSIDHIGKGAFENNSIREIKMVNFPDLVGLDDKVFSNNQITLVSLNDMQNLKRISESAFVGNPIQEVFFKKIPLLERIEKNSFKGQRLLNRVTIQDCIQLQSIEEGAFENNQIEVLYLSDGLKNFHSIGEGAFKGNKINHLRLPISTKNIGDKAFEDNKQMRTANFKELTKLETIGYRAFNRNGLEGDLKITSKKLRKIDNEAFNSNNLNKVDLSEAANLTEIDEGAFANNNNLEELILGPHIRSIGKNAFANTNIKCAVRLPITLVHLGDGAFPKGVDLCRECYFLKTCPKVNFEHNSCVPSQGCKV